MVSLSKVQKVQLEKMVFREFQVPRDCPVPPGAPGKPGVLLDPETGLVRKIPFSSKRFTRFTCVLDWKFKHPLPFFVIEKGPKGRV